LPHYQLYRIAGTLCRVTPKRLAYFAAERVADLHYLFASGSRSAVRRNMIRILARPASSGDPGRRRVRYLTRKTFENFAIHVIDFLRSDQTMTDVRLGLIEIENFHRFEEALSMGRGVISATACQWVPGFPPALNRASV